MAPDPSDQKLNDLLAELPQERGIKVRRSIAGGLSGAQIYLVECQLDGEQRLAILKVASAG
jgi:hypothetical protein